MAKRTTDTFFTRTHWVSQRNEHGWAKTNCGTSLEWNKKSGGYALASGGKVPTAELYGDATCPACLSMTHWRWKE